MENSKRLPYVSVAEFIGSDRGDKVNSCIGLSNRPARLHGLAGRYGNPMQELTLSPSHGSMNSATGNKEERDTRDASGKETDEGRSAS